MDFPQGGHDDLLDATAAALDWRGDGGYEYADGSAAAGGAPATETAQTLVPPIEPWEGGDEDDRDGLDRTLGAYA